MKKKIILVLVLAAFTAAGAFAQFGIEIFGQVHGNNYYTNTNTPVTPTIGVDINLGGMDVLAGVSFISNTTGNKEDKYRNTYWNLGIYAGVAPRMSDGRWALSIPLLAQFGFGGRAVEPSSESITPGSIMTSSRFNIGFHTGAKVEYAVTSNISIFTGVLLNVITYEERETLRWKGPTVGAGTESNPNPDTIVTIFNSGRILFGAKINF